MTPPELSPDGAPELPPDGAPGLSPDRAPGLSADGARGRSTGGADPTADLPVLLDLPAELHEPARSWVEGVLGWQPVDPDTDVLVPAQLRLVGVDAPASSTDDVPAVLLVDGDRHPAEVAAAAVRSRPVATLRWPDDRDGLADAAVGGLQAPRATASGPRLVRIGGAAGGVGTSTVAAALAGLFGWQGEPTLAVLGATAPVDDVRAVAAGALGSAGLWSQASPLVGVARTRAVRVSGGLPAAEAVADPMIRVCVIDAGVTDDVDVLVCRPDAAGLAAAGRTTAAAVVVVGTGPAPASSVRDACGPRRRVHLPRSARVARAGLRGRVPAGLPGTWLRPLLPLTRGGPP